MVVDSEQKSSTNEESITTTVNDNDPKALESLYSLVNELQNKQNDVHRNIRQLSSIMSDLEYYMNQIRHIKESSNDNTNDLCQSLLSHLESIVNDTRSTLVSSTTTANNAQQVYDIVQSIYEENQRIAHHIDDLIQQDQFDTEISNEKVEEDHIQKAIEHIELALEENKRDYEYINNEREKFENNQKTIETFIHTTEQLHDLALGKIHGHIKEIQEQNQSLRRCNEQIDTLTKQFQQNSFLSS